MQRLPGSTEDAVALCAGLPASSGVAYEAGPGGFRARALTAARVGCVVAAPEAIELPGQVRIKTDMRDAERLVRHSKIHGLQAVRLPMNEEEALRDLAEGLVSVMALTSRLRELSPRSLRAGHERGWSRVSGPISTIYHQPTRTHDLTHKSCAPIFDTSWVALAIITLVK